MVVDLLSRARQDAHRIVTGEFGVELTLTPSVGDAVVVRGLASKHHLQIDPETGYYINAKNTHASIAESDLIAAGYTVRNANNEVDMKRHQISYADSTGTVANYLIDETRPDETLGLIVCVLGDYRP